MTDQPTILITGANRGLGLAFARHYAGRGWSVIATARTPDKAEALNALAAEQEGVEVVALDVSRQQSVEALAERLAGRPIDVLLSNASHMIHLADQTFGQADADQFSYSYEVNAVGPFRLAQALIDNVRASTARKMIFVGSTAGSMASIQPPVMLFGYCPAKAGLHSIVRGLHLNLAPEGVTVGLIEPGVVDTQGFADVKPGEPAPYGMDAVVEMVRAGKLQMARPDDAAVRLAALIDQLSPETGGVLTRIDGEIIPW